ncbi:putative zinc-binding peptidase [Stieleria sp. JC731]|uniref:zinc-binding metallopeptidase family protein n=1 Tax=Pirellulaceae TaxID=2691357 RepID=UPI001E4CDE77|nr:putative zinc-binding metallopeptidase [Stieleria sp. JC731]MCC9601199.1 putative zinc-binding peptidase [Stieleria sp. JC731]
MRTFQCGCGADLFFHSAHCISCGRMVSRCASCQTVTSVDQNTGTCDSCSTKLEPCKNRVDHEVCNGTVLNESNETHCRYCTLNRVIPDLSLEGNLEKWRLAERAKQRVLFDIDRIGLPIDDDDTLPLVFEFKTAEKEPVSTGHADGVITLDLAEADSVHRERTRVQFGEPHRTLVGHFRHELGHYFWQKCVLPGRIELFRELFGDERNPSYAEARDQYYNQRAPANWQQAYVSEYATMHPWEDFAETFNAYLDMIAIARTFGHFQKGGYAINEENFDFLITDYRNIGIMANELNRDMGLLDLVPEVFTPPVIEKMRFIHEMARRQTEPSGSPAKKARVAV